MTLVKVAITGPESTGKSMLTEALASHYRAPWASEYAREYLRKTDGKYAIEDLANICEGQIALEERAISEADQVCFFDTDMLVLKVWAQYRFGRVPMRIEQALEHRKYHLSLLCKPDLPWTPDPFRESPDPDERNLLYHIYKSQLEDAAMPYVEIGGVGEERLAHAIGAVGSLLENPKKAGM